MALGLHTVSTELVPRGDGIDIGTDTPVGCEKLLSFQRPRHTNSGGQNGGFGSTLELPFLQQVQPLQQAINVETFRFFRLKNRLVIDGEVVHHVGIRVSAAIHPLETGLDDVRNLVGVRRVVGDHSGVSRRQKG